MTERGRRALRALCETLVPDARPDLAERVAGRVARLPRAAERANLGRVLWFMESPLCNLFLGFPLPFSELPPADRERYLRRWAASRSTLLRRAFQGLKRLVTSTHYTAARDAGDPVWRDLGYPGPLAPEPAPAPRIRPLSIERDTVLECDVVIVGSGAAGAVIAAELSARGADVIVLEKGGYYAPADFTGHEGDMVERLYDAGGLRSTADLGMLVLQGSCVGGGTVVNYSTSFHTPAAVREAWAREHGLPHFTTTAFTNSLDAVAARLNVNTEESRPGGRDRVLLRGLERLGWHRAPLPRNVRACAQDEACGYCGYGCRRGAKQSVLVTYLADAAQRGARIVEGVSVERVLFERGRAVGVLGRPRPRPHPRVRLTVRARTVCLAAGAIHAPVLLLRSGVRLPALGRHLALHPATAVFGVMDEPVRPWGGTLQGVYSDQFADLDGAGYGVKFETAPLHPALAALAAPWESAAGHREIVRKLPRTALVGLLLRDRTGGRVTADRRGEPVIHYQVPPYDQRHVRRGIEAGAELLEAAGAREIWVPSARWIPLEPGGAAARRRWLERLDANGYGSNQLFYVSFHQMASCRMGASAARSVVNSDHQVWGIPGLYVADAGVFPSSSGVNPMLTVMAIAHRAGQLIV